LVAGINASYCCGGSKRQSAGAGVACGHVEVADDEPSGPGRSLLKGGDGSLMLGWGMLGLIGKDGMSV